MGRGERKGLTIDEDEEYNNTSFVGMESTFNVEGDVGINAEGIRDLKSGERLGRQICPDDLKQQGVIGRGACSSVELCRHLRTNEVFALKKFNVFEREKRQQLIQEINTLYRVECPSLIGFYGAYQKKGHIYVILENMDRGSLNDLVYQYDPMPEKVLAAITYQILWGLAYLHYENRLHRDIKPSNILVNSSGEIKLTDFGIAKELDASSMAETIIGTFRYMSPLRLRGQPYGPPSDIWSLGIMLVECANRALPFPNSNTEIEISQAIAEMDIEEMLPKTTHSEEFWEVLRCCLDPVPEKRMTAEVLLESPWMQDNEVNDLDSAIEITCQWLEDNPAPEGSLPSALGKSNMISTLHSECSDDSDEDEKYEYKK